jgi:glycosyltransferase involved in cell wall biosynthesis
MKILHLYSDWKWTGPAEPAIQMCQALQAEGHEVTFACRAMPTEHQEPETVEMKAREAGLQVTTKFGLNRYFGIRDTVHDLHALPRFLENEKVEILHTHLSHDHAFGLYASKLTSRKLAVAHSMHRRRVLKDRFWNRRLLASPGKNRGICVFTAGFKEEYATRFDIPQDQIAICPMPLDLARFLPDRSFVNQRERYDIPADCVLIGIVARFQKYRRMDVFMEAASMVLKEEPNVRFVAIGRSSQVRETVVRPMEELGIRDKVVLTGYLIDNYIDMLQTLDAFTLMIPGFDGTARALREAMALGKPCVVSDVGMLPDIVAHEKAGFVCEFANAESLADAWLQLVRSAKLRQAMGNYASSYAHKTFRLESLGKSLQDFYSKLLASS